MKYTCTCILHEINISNVVCMSFKICVELLFLLDIELPKYKFSCKNDYSYFQICGPIFFYCQLKEKVNIHFSGTLMSSPYTMVLTSHSLKLYWTKYERRIQKDNCKYLLTFPIRSSTIKHIPVLHFNMQYVSASPTSLKASQLNSPSYFLQNLGIMSL